MPKPPHSKRLLFAATLLAALAPGNASADAVVPGGSTGDRVVDARRQVMRVEVAVRRDILAYDMDLATLRQQADAARARFHEARGEVIEGLERQPEYRRLQGQVDAAERALKDAGGSFETRFEQANRLLTLRSRLGAMRHEAAMADPAVLEAHFALQDAYAAWVQARQEVEQRVADNPQLRAARAELLAARRHRANLDG